MAAKKISKKAREEKPREPVRYDVGLLTDNDLYLFNQGSHFRLYDKLGAHLMTVDGRVGTYFAVWAPNAEQVFVIGDFNAWDKSSHPLRLLGQSGIWGGFIPGMEHGTIYKYYIMSRYKGYRADKADPFAFCNEVSPKTGSIVANLEYTWGDREWMSIRHDRNASDAPMAIAPGLLDAGTRRELPPSDLPRNGPQAG